MASKLKTALSNTVNNIMSTFGQQTEQPQPLLKDSPKIQQAPRPVSAYPTLVDAKDGTLQSKRNLMGNQGSGLGEINPGDKINQVVPGGSQQKSIPKRNPILEALKASVKEKKQQRNEMKLHNAMQEKITLMPSPEVEEDPRAKNTRSSQTIRRYSQLPRENRLSIKYRDILNNERPSSQNSTLGSIISIGKASTSATASASSASVGKTNSIRFENARRSSTRRSHKTSLKSRRAEEGVMHDMVGSRQIRHLVTKTHFNESEVKCLQRIYTAFTGYGQDAGISRVSFREIMMKQFGISGDAMLDQIYYYFDTEHEGFISSTEWIISLSTFLRGTFEEHTQFCYGMYDLKGEGAIGKGEILTLLQDCLRPVPGVEEEIADNSNVREVADMLLRKFDKDNKRYITYDNFRSVVRRDPLCLQCLGQCLPEPRDVKTFMSLIADDYNSFRSNYSLPRMPNYNYERDRFNAGVQESRIQTAFKRARSAVGLFRGILAIRENTIIQIQGTNRLLKG
ncbi:unnamed protein product [Allacma fusca]|uniref:EF-hand domain-containing protein n=1 Tax=Allacma fusca TaxID=39272 RepID=A0A8J2MG24_9HEXA|nr:unnamed protein product [Allacma fusca]